MTAVDFPTPAPGGSPFDMIRRTRPDGSEYWSARDLMPLLGYGADWRNFRDAIERAKASAKAQGQDPETVFGGVTENPGPKGGRPREDLHLSRFASYLVAMNGDPRKPEVAAAQTYFAVRTRQAELTRPTLTGPELMAAALIEAHRTLDTANARVLELTPKARQFDNFLSAVGDYSVAQAAQALNRAGAKTGQNRLHKVMAEIGWLYKPEGHKRWRVYQTASDSGYVRVRPTTYQNQTTGEDIATSTVRVTPKGLDALAHHFNVVIPEEPTNAAA